MKRLVRGQEIPNCACGRPVFIHNDGCYRTFRGWTSSQCEECSLMGLGDFVAVLGFFIGVVVGIVI